LGTLSISLFGLVVWAVFRSSSSEDSNEKL
jgi:hypothetical protein